MKALVTGGGGFLGGAIVAALWIHGRPAGLYDMQDVLGLNPG